MNRRTALLAGAAVLALAVGAGAGALLLRDDEQPPAAAPPAAGAVDVVAVGDIACTADEEPDEDSCQHAATARTAAAVDPDAVLLLGDIQYPEGSVEDFTAEGGYTGTWSALLDRTLPAAGNHEWDTRDAAGYREVFDERTGGEWWYSRDLGGWHVVSLSSDCEEVGGCEVGSEQHDWFLADLEEHDGRPTLVFWHTPRFSTGRHGGDRDVEDLWETAVADRDVQVVLASHNHHYERFEPLDAEGEPDPEGLPSFVVGTGGRSFYCDRTEDQPEPEVFDCESFGVLHLRLHEDGYAWRFVATTGDLEDSGEQPLR